MMTLGTLVLLLIWQAPRSLAQGGNLIGFGPPPAGAPPFHNNAIAVSAGHITGAAALADGRFITWGGGPAPPLDLSAPAVDVWAFLEFSMALLADGSLSFAVADGDPAMLVPPEAVDLIAADFALRNVVGLRSDGRVVGWGTDFGGGGRFPIPAEFDDEVFVDVAIGFIIGGAALRPDGTVVTWGTMPGTPPGFDDIISIEMGDRQIIGLKSDGSTVTFGLDGSPSQNLGPAMAVDAAIFNGFAALSPGGDLRTWPEGQAIAQDVFGFALGKDSREVVAIQKPGMLPFANVLPAAVKKVEGSTVVLRAHAIGATTYQWKRNGVAIAGGNKPWYVFESLGRRDTGSYSLEMTNANGSFETEPIPVALDLIDQAITVQPIGEKRYGDPPFDLIATASSGLPVQLTLESGPAVLDGNNVRITGNGTVIIVVEQPGNFDFEPAPPLRIVFDTGSVAGPLTGITPDPGGLRIEVPWFSTRAIGIEYSPDMTPGSWIELGNAFLDGTVGAFVDPDPVRQARPRGFYRAFLRPAVP